MRVVYPMKFLSQKMTPFSFIHSLVAILIGCGDATVDVESGSDKEPGRTNCEVLEVETGAEITCGANTVLIRHGADGTAGQNGAIGESGEKGEKGDAGATSQVLVQDANENELGYLINSTSTGIYFLTNEGQIAYASLKTGEIGTEGMVVQSGCLYESTDCSGQCYASIEDNEAVATNFLTRYNSSYYVVNGSAKETVYYESYRLGDSECLIASGSGEGWKTTLYLGNIPQSISLPIQFNSTESEDSQSSE